jgi:hypothetical protein
VVLEVDNTTVIRTLISKQQDRSRHWTIYEESKRRLHIFDEVVVQHSKRETNMVADSLAKLATFLGEREIRDDLPDSVRELVLADAACIAT